MQHTERVGTRVATIRKVRGWTARELAANAHVSYSLLTKVESGHAAATPAFIGAVARALRVDVPRLTGQPYEEPRGSGARLHATIGPIRRSIDTYDLPDDTIVPRPVSERPAGVRLISALGGDARFVQIGEILPGLLDELTTAVHTAPDSSRPQLFGLLAEAYSGASAIAGLLGYLDLRREIVDRTLWASERCDDPLRMHRVAWQRTASLMASAAYPQALRLMDQTRHALGDDITAMDPPTLSVYGSTHLRSAILAARAARTNGPGSAQAAWDHLTAARATAAQLGADRNDYGLAFGPSNVAQHEVAVAVELEDSTPAVRRGHHYIDLARGYYMAGDSPGALRCLGQARHITPQQTRHHPMVRETVLAIASTGRGSEELTQFATWLAIA